MPQRSAHERITARELAHLARMTGARHTESLPLLGEALYTQMTQSVRENYSSMFERDFFQEEQKTGPSRAGKTVGAIGSWGLHLALITFMLYSGYHGIHATATYRAESGLGNIAGIVGIVTIELVLASLYLAWHNGRITGAAQSIAAGVTYGIGFILACLGIVADSQLQAGLTLSPWLSSYLTWMLPIAPAVMALGALLTHELAPAQLRARRESEKRDEVDEARFTAHMARLLADMEAAKTVANMQLNAKTAAAKQIGQWYSGEQAQRAITSTAKQNAPALLRSIGIDVAEGAEAAQVAEKLALLEAALAQKATGPAGVHVNGNGSGPSPLS